MSVRASSCDMQGAEGSLCMSVRARSCELYEAGGSVCMSVRASSCDMQGIEDLKASLQALASDEVQIGLHKKNLVQIPHVSARVRKKSEKNLVRIPHVSARVHRKVRNRGISTARPACA